MFLRTMIELALGRGNVSAVPTVARRPSGHRELSFQNAVRNRDQTSRRSGGSYRGLFDPLFSGLSAHAAGIDAAIYRRTCLR
jgi:hypothetical protein